MKIADILMNQNRSNGIWNHIAQEALLCLKADRFTIFTWDDGKESLDIEHTAVAGPQYEKIGEAAEKEIALRMRNLKNPLLLAEPKDISKLIKWNEGKTEITSFIGVPLNLQDHSTRIFCSSRVGKLSGFIKEDLDFLNILSSLGLIAKKMDSLSQKAEEGTTLRNQYEKYLDSIMGQLQSLFRFEKNIMGEHISRLITIQGKDEAHPSEPEGNSNLEMKPKQPLADDAHINRRASERVNVAVQIDFKGEFIGISNNLSVEGAFIEIPAPLDLQEIFDLRFHLPNGGTPIEAKCKVVWSNKYGKETEVLRRGMGVKFQNLSLEAKSQIQEFISGNHSILKGEIEFVGEEFGSPKKKDQSVRK